MSDLSLNSLFGSDDTTPPEPDASHGLTMDTLFGAPPPVKAGPLADASIAMHSIGKVLEAFGQGAAQGWGSEPFMVGTPVQDALRQNGGWDQYAQRQSAVMKGFNEAIVRPSAAVLDAVAGPAATVGSILTRGIPAALEGTERGLVQASEESEKIPGVGHALAAIPGGAAELLGYIADTFIPELAIPMRVANLQRARSVGAIGPDGEVGFFDTKPVTPEEAAARATAAQEAGEAPAPAPTQPAQPEGPPAPTAETPAPPTVNEVARQVYPETFQQYDALAAQKDAAKAELAALPGEEPPVQDVHAVARQIAPDVIAERDYLESRRASFQQWIPDLYQRARANIEAKPPLAVADIDAKIAAQQRKVDNAGARTVDRQQAALQDLKGQREAIIADAIRNDLGINRVRQDLERTNARLGEIGPQVRAAYEEAATHLGPTGPEAAEATPEPVSTERQAKAPAPAQEIPAPTPGEDTASTAVVNSPEAARLLNTIIDAENKQRELIPQIVEANQHATSLMPEGAVTERAAVETEAAETATGKKPPAKAVGAEAEAGAAGKPAPTPRATGMKAVEGTGDVQARKLSEGIEAKAIENTLTEGFGDLPEYRQLSMADQAERAAQVVREDYEAAKDMAMGKKQPPKGVLPESILVAVENRALAEGDVDTLRQLATTSRLTTEATTMGQRIRTLAERDPSSPVGAIKTVQDAREADYAKRNAAQGAQSLDAAKETVAQQIKTEMKKAASKPEAWENFIHAITCEGEE